MVEFISNPLTSLRGLKAAPCGRLSLFVLAFFIMSKVWVYVDGFNLYNGALRRTPHKWLDLVALSQRLLQPLDVVEQVKFFTAQVERRPSSPDQQMNQRLYWRALRTLGEVEIIEGQFRGRHKYLPLSASYRQLESDAAAGISVAGRNPQMAEVYKCEEKGTDVNLAAHLVHDAHMGRFELALVISNDSDLATSIRLVTQQVGLPVGVYSPQRNASLRELQIAATFYRKMDRKYLAQSQLQTPLSDARGPFQKPPSW